MTYWKFLRPGAVGPFSGHRWDVRATDWTSSSQVRGCLVGVHACRQRDLPFWLAEELWQVELAGEIVESAEKVIAPRGRLVCRVDAWTAGTARDFAFACLTRTVQHAVAELRDAGLADEADRLADLGPDPSPDVLAELAPRSAATATSRERRQAAVLCGYVGDAAECIDLYPVASIAYIAARAANQRSTAPGPDPYLDERAWQSRWLADRLGLAEPVRPGGE